MRAMDLAKTLIRTIVRAFYETKHVLVIDALMVHSAFVTQVAYKIILLSIEAGCPMRTLRLC